MITVKVTFSDGDTITTRINTDLQGAKNYYIGKDFNFGDTEEHPADKLVRAVSVEQIENTPA